MAKPPPSVGRADRAVSSTPFSSGTKTHTINGKEHPCKGITQTTINANTTILTRFMRSPSRHNPQVVLLFLLGYIVFEEEILGNAFTVILLFSRHGIHQLHALGVHVQKIGVRTGHGGKEPGIPIK